MIYNNSQKKAVMHTTGPMMVLAGPGSGKTAVITGRTCQLVTSGISASRILVVTFTRAAAKEMKERYLKAMGKTSTQVTFGTFHGVFYAILRHTYRMSGNNILSEEEKKRLMQRAGQPLCQRPGGRGSRGKSGARNQHCEEQSDPAGTLLFRLYAAGKVPRNL